MKNNMAEWTRNRRSKAQSKKKRKKSFFYFFYWVHEGIKCRYKCTSFERRLIARQDGKSPRLTSGEKIAFSVNLRLNRHVYISHCVRSSKDVIFLLIFFAVILFSTSNGSAKVPTMSRPKRYIKNKNKKPIPFVFSFTPIGTLEMPSLKESDIRICCRCCIVIDITQNRIYNIWDHMVPVCGAYKSETFRHICKTYDYTFRLKQIADLLKIHY